MGQKASSKKLQCLTTVITEFQFLGESYLNCQTKRRNRFLVLPFGLNYAPEEFQMAMDEIYEDEDINPYFDDIALGSSTAEEHCRLLHRTILKARKANLKFKCVEKAAITNFS
ncbi:transposon Tf2-9 polyprotein [Trichonephila clavipes]|nr:transposon Tf2-9 polyprotein [Trichonephila clavipes]